MVKIRNLLRLITSFKNISKFYWWMIWYSLKKVVFKGALYKQWVSGKIDRLLLMHEWGSDLFPYDIFLPLNYTFICTRFVQPNARIKGHLEPTHLKSSPLFTFSTKLLGQDSPSIHLFSKIIGSRFTTAKIKLGEDSPSWFVFSRSRFAFKQRK